MSGEFARREFARRFFRSLEDIDWAKVESRSAPDVQLTESEAAAWVALVAQIGRQA